LRLATSGLPDRHHSPEAPVIKAIKFVGVPVSDQQRALDFYTKTLGFRVITDQPFDDKQRWIELRVGSSETRIVLFQFGEQGLQPGMPFNGALACDNVEQTYQEMVAKGVEFKTPPQKQPWGMFAIFSDPDGNQFVLSSR